MRHVSQQRNPWTIDGCNEFGEDDLFCSSEWGREPKRAIAVPDRRTYATRQENLMADITLDKDINAQIEELRNQIGKLSADLASR